MRKKIELARILTEERNYEEAEDILKSLLLDEPDSEVIHYELGKVYFEWEDFDSASSEFEKTISLDTSFFQAYLMLGLSYEKVNKLYSAEESYIKAIDLKPHFWASYTQLASLYREQKDLLRAQYILEEGLKRECSHHLLHMNLGSVYSLRGFLDKSLEQLNIARKMAPDSFEILTSLGELYLARREYEKALEVFEEKKNFYPEDSFSYQHIGSVYHTMLDFENAEKYYNKAITKENADGGIYYLLSIIRSRIHKDYEKAIEYAEEAVKLDPEFVSAYFAEIECYYHLKALSTVKEKYVKLVEEKPKNPIFYMALGTYYLHCEEFENAKNTFHKAIEVNRKGEPFKSIYGVYVSLGRTYDFLGNIPKAIEYIKIPLMEEPYCGELHFELGRLYEKMGEEEKSRSSFERVSVLLPNSVMAYCARAHNYLKNGNTERAKAEVNEGEKYSYRSDKVAYLLGLIEEKNGNIEGALDYFDLTVEYNHLHMEARKGIERLKKL